MRYNTLYAFLLALVVAPSVHAGAAVISDGTFANTDWDAFVAGSGFSGGAGQGCCAGNPGTYFGFSGGIGGGADFTFPNGYAHIYNAASYDPSTGAVLSLTFSWDQRRFAPVPPDITSQEITRAAIRQGTCIYSASGGGGRGTNAGWGAQNYGPLLMNNFGLFNTGEPGCAANPVFNFSGAPMQFGFIGSFLGAGSPSSDAAIDNFSVTVQFDLASLDASPIVLSHGDVLIGTVSSEPLTVTNDSPLVSSLSGNFPGAASPHGPGGGQAFGPLAMGESTNRDYTFTPTVRGGIGVVGTVISNGGSQLINFQGAGVAPIQEVVTTFADAGPTRLGTTDIARVVVNNNGDGNDSGEGASSNLNGTAPAGAGQFSGPAGGTAISVPDNGTLNLDYTYTPDDRTPDSQNLTISFSNGNSNEQNGPQDVGALIEGIGVGPIFASLPVPTSTLDFGEAVSANELITLQIQVDNTSTDDPNGQLQLTDMSVVGALSGPGAQAFLIDPQFVVGQENFRLYEVTFAPQDQGDFTATLTLTTDEDRPFDDLTGPTYTYELSGKGTYSGPIPALSLPGLLVLILGVGLIGLLRARPGRNPG